jgi:hypothetical protein
MQFLLDQAAVDEMSNAVLSRDCYAREKHYPHHVYRGGEKCLVVRALYAALNEARAKGDKEAIAHLTLHERQVKEWAAEMERQKQGQPPSDLLKDFPAYVSGGLEIVEEEPDNTPLFPYYPRWY